LLEDASEIRQISANVKGLQQAHAAKEFETFRPGQPSRPAVIDQEDIRTELLAEENCAHFSRAQSESLLTQHKFSRTLKTLDLNPFRVRHLGCPRQARPGDDDFIVNFRRDADARKKAPQEVKATKLA